MESEIPAILKNIYLNMLHILKFGEMFNEKLNIQPVTKDRLTDWGWTQREYIDFGDKTTVYWAKYALEIDGENRFYFDEVKDFNEFGWRLPTVKEVEQIFKPKTRWDSPWYDGCRIIKIKGEELRIKGNVSDGFHIWTKDVDNRWDAPHAYSYVLTTVMCLTLIHIARQSIHFMCFL